MADQADERFGKTLPRYSFLLNAHPDQRLSSCPKCRRPTHARKFALFVSVKGYGPLVLGKTCKFCTPCELILCDQAELEAELVVAFEKIGPEHIGNEYLVLGTFDKNAWKQGVKGKPVALDQSTDYLADFVKYYDLEVDPGGWRRA